MYYFLNGEIDEKIIGVYPQLSNYHYEGRDTSESYKIFEGEQFGVIRNDAPVTGLTLYPKAKVTDYIENTHILVNERLYDELAKLNIPPFRVRLMQIKKLQKTYDYMMFSTINLEKHYFGDFIDYENTIFWVFKDKKPLGRVDFQTKEEYLRLKQKFEVEMMKSRNFISYCKIVIVDLKLTNSAPDLLEQHNFGFPLPIVSEKFRVLALEKGFSGMRFQPITEGINDSYKRFGAVENYYVHPT
jgi:hypothetical protein